MGEVDSQELCVISDRSDPLSYGKNRQCFIQTINRISLSSWGEITTSQYEGIVGLFNCLTDIINNNKKPLSLSNLKLVCHTPTRATGITLRLKQLFNTLIKLYPEQQTNHLPRYILPGGTSFYIFQAKNKSLSYQELATEKRLLQELARPLEQFSTVDFEPAVLANTPIHLIYALNKPLVIQLFYYESKVDISIYIIDEKGSLYIQQHNKTNSIHLLKHYVVFLESILNRSLFERVLTIEYHEIRKSSAGIFSHHPTRIKVSLSSNELNLRITGEANVKGIIYTIYCNEQEFSSLDHGNRVFDAVYQYILQFRSGKLDYPVYITDIDLPLSALGINNFEQLQTIHYLNYKQKIEEKFNI
jgi:adenylate cyclase class 1